MTTTEENMRTFLLSDASIKTACGSRVAYNNFAQTKGNPRIFFQQSGSVDDVALDDQPGLPTRIQFAVESIDSTPEGAIALKNIVQAKLNKGRSTFGDATVQGIFAADASMDYVPRGGGEDSGQHTSSLIAEVVL